MKIQQLQLLQAIQRTGSLRALSHELHLSQPALTKALKQLEQEFGTTLVVRGPKGVHLAPAGEKLVVRAGSILREVARARDEIAWMTREAEAFVSVGVSPAVAILLTPGAIKRLHARRPGVRVQITETSYPQLTTQVRSGEVDFAIGPLPQEKQMMDLRVRHLFDNRLVIAARKGHPLEQARRLRDVVTASWVLTGRPNGPGDPKTLPFAALKLPVPVPRVECASFSTLLAIMPESDYIGVLPRGFFERHGPTYGLIDLPIEDPIESVGVHIISRMDVPLTPAAQLLEDAFYEEARLLKLRG